MVLDEFEVQNLWNKSNYSCSDVKCMVDVEDSNKQQVKSHADLALPQGGTRTITTNKRTLQEWAGPAYAGRDWVSRHPITGEYLDPEVAALASTSNKKYSNIRNMLGFIWMFQDE